MRLTIYLPVLVKQRSIFNRLSSSCGIRIDSSAKLLGKVTRANDRSWLGPGGLICTSDSGPAVPLHAFKAGDGGHGGVQLLRGTGVNRLGVLTRVSVEIWRQRDGRDRVSARQVGNMVPC